MSISDNGGFVLTKHQALALAFREYVAGNIDRCPSTGVVAYADAAELEELLESLIPNVIVLHGGWSGGVVA